MPIKRDDALDAIRFYLMRNDGTYEPCKEFKGSITISPDVVEPLMWWGTDGLLYVYCDWMV